MGIDVGTTAYVPAEYRHATSPWQSHIRPRPFACVALTASPSHPPEPTDPPPIIEDGYRSPSCSHPCTYAGTGFVKPDHRTPHHMAVHPHSCSSAGEEPIQP